MSGRPTVAGAMVTDVKLSRADVTVRELRALFADEHVQSAVLVTGGGPTERGRLVAVVDRADLDRRPDDARAAAFGGRGSRTVAPGDDLDAARHALLVSGRRRLAVVDDDGRVLGLLCLKRSRRGFCSDRDVVARSTERAASQVGAFG